MVEVNLNCESDVTPDKYVIENILNGKCDIILNENITEHSKKDENGEFKTYYTYDIYRIPTIYRDNLEKELSTAKGYKTWINFAKEKYAKQIVDIPDVDRISALEQAIMEIGEVLGNG